MQPQPRELLVRVPEDEEIVGYVARLAEKHGIRTGVVLGIGAFKEATIAYFLPDEGRYRNIEVREQVELLSLVGNISLREDGSVFPHLHATLGRSDGSVIGGHLVRGRVFLVELYVREVAGELLVRRPWRHVLQVWPETRI